MNINPTYIMSGGCGFYVYAGRLRTSRDIKDEPHYINYGKKELMNFRMRQRRNIWDLRSNV